MRTFCELHCQMFCNAEMIEQMSIHCDVIIKSGSLCISMLEKIKIVNL
jgi:hypothetical protein